MSKAMYRNKVEGWKKKDLLVKKPEIKKEKIDFLNKAKQERKTSQYSALISISKEKSHHLIETAKKFVNRLSDIILE